MITRKNFPKRILSMFMAICIMAIAIPKIADESKVSATSPGPRPAENLNYLISNIVNVDNYIAYTFNYYSSDPEATVSLYSPYYDYDLAVVQFVNGNYMGWYSARPGTNPSTSVEIIRLTPPPVGSVQYLIIVYSLSPTPVVNPSLFTLSVDPTWLQDTYSQTFNSAIGTNPGMVYSNPLSFTPSSSIPRGAEVSSVNVQGNWSNPSGFTAYLQMSNASTSNWYFSNTSTNGSGYFNTTIPLGSWFDVYQTWQIRTAQSGTSNGLSFYNFTITFNYWYDWAYAAYGY